MELRRGQLGKRIEFYTHRKYGGKVPIYLDSDGQFSAVIGDVVLHASELKKIKALTDEALKNQTNLEWIPLIEISFGWSWRSSDDDDRNKISREVKFEFERYWIAKKIDNKWIEASWDVEHYRDIGKKKIEVGDRLERSKSFSLQVYDRTLREHRDVENFKLPYTRKSEDRDENPVYYIPYDEALWLTLIELSKRMDQLQLNLMQILGSTEKRAALTAQIQKLLPAGEKP